MIHSIILQHEGTAASNNHPCPRDLYEHLNILYSNIVGEVVEDIVYDTWNHQISCYSEAWRNSQPFGVTSRGNSAAHGRVFVSGTQARLRNLGGSWKTCVHSHRSAITRTSFIISDIDWYVFCSNRLTATYVRNLSYKLLVGMWSLIPSDSSPQNASRPYNQVIVCQLFPMDINPLYTILVPFLDS